jgi:Fe-S-cluster containining protein
MTIPILTKKQLQWFDARGLKVVKKKQGYKIIYPSRCQHLVYDMNIAICQIHDAKPDICWDAKCPLGAP